jgi:hypothetical protein
MDPTTLVIAILVVTMLFMAGMVWLGPFDMVQAIARMDRSATAAEHAAEVLIVPQQTLTGLQMQCMALAEQVRDLLTAVLNERRHPGPTE